MPEPSTNKARLAAQLDALRETGAFGVFAALLRDGAAHRWICAALRLTEKAYAAALVDLDNRRAQLLPTRLDGFAPHVSGTLRAICEFVLVQLRKRHPAALLQDVFRYRVSDTETAVLRQGSPRLCVEKLPLPIPPAFRAVENISPTRLDGYLRCPFTAYLHEKNVLGPRLWDPFAVRLARWEFGNLVHAALESFGGDAAIRDETDASKISAFLSLEVDRWLADRFGAAIPESVVAQGEEAKRRLAAFAALQSSHRTAGWKIVAAEERHEVACPFLRSDGSRASVLIYGKCDRIDQNERTGEWMVIDYKTMDRASEIPQGLQLPLYCAMLAKDRISACYCVLGASAEETVFTSPVGGEAIGAALRKAGEGVSHLERGIFWPPSPLRIWKREFGEWLLPSPEATVAEEWLADQRARFAGESGGPCGT